MPCSTPDNYDFTTDGIEDWSTACDSACTWTVEDDHGPGNPYYGALVRESGVTENSVLTTTVGSPCSTVNADCVFLFRICSRTASASVQFGIEFYEDETYHDGGGVQLFCATSSDDDKYRMIDRDSCSAVTVLGSEITDVIIDPDKWYCARIQMRTYTLRVAVWEWGDPVPETWNIETTSYGCTSQASKFFMAALGNVEMRVAYCSLATGIFSYADMPANPVVPDHGEMDFETFTIAGLGNWHQGIIDFPDAVLDSAGAAAGSIDCPDAVLDGMGGGYGNVDVPDAVIFSCWGTTGDAATDFADFTVEGISNSRYGNAALDFADFIVDTPPYGLDSGLEYLFKNDECTISGRGGGRASFPFSILAFSISGEGDVSLIGDGVIEFPRLMPEGTGYHGSQADVEFPDFELEALGGNSGRSGDLYFPSFAVSGLGKQGVIASVSVYFPDAYIEGSGYQDYLGDGALAFSNFVIAGEGLGGIGGQGVLSFPSFVIDSSARIEADGYGSIEFPEFLVYGEGFSIDRCYRKVYAYEG